MSLQVSLTGQLVAGPSASSDNQFPSGTDTTPFGLVQDPRQYAVRTGTQQVNVNSPSSFTALGGIGSSSSVSSAFLLYMRTTIGMDVRITRVNPAGGSFVTTEHVAGLLVYECDAAQPITLVEVQGAGQLEFAAFGNA